jgi:hypothetical protein
MEYGFFAKVVERGSPAFINGLLHEIYDKSLANTPPLYDWYWVEPGRVLARLPSSLTLITKDPLIDFDIRGGQQAGDFFITNDLLAVLREATKFRCQAAALSIVGPDGRPRSQRSYSYIRLEGSERITRNQIDDKLSKIQYRKSGEIKHIDSLVLKKNILKNVFMVNELAIFRHLFVSKWLGDVIDRRSWCGFSIEASESIGSLDRV